MGDSAAGDLDRISALPDDLLHLILTRVECAVSVTRTAVLSRRWRHVWVHAKSLTFDGKSKDLIKRSTAPDYLAGFVDWALAQRGDAAGMESLQIRFPPNSCASPSPEQVKRWLRYAGRHVAGSLDLYIPSKAPADEDVELPAVGVPTQISLYLPHRKLRLPPAAAAMYGALTELELLAVRFGEEASGATLGDFLSSCCPRLRKLKITAPKGLHRLVLRAEELQELRLSSARDLQTLDATAPNLRVVKLVSCFHNPSIGIVINHHKVARIKAPRLEKIGMRNAPRRRPALDIVHGLDGVRCVSDIVLDVHGKYYLDTDVGLWLLERCLGVQHVDVRLVHVVASGVNPGELVDLTSEGAAPFTSVRSMKMVVTRTLDLDRQRVANISALLTRCPRLRSLQVNIIFGGNTLLPFLGNQVDKCFCDDLDKWEFDGKIVLESLEEVKITDFTGAVEEMHLLRLLFESSNSFKRMALLPLKNKKNRLVFKEGGDAETILQELTKIPCADGGRWHFVKKTFIWMCNSEISGMQRSSAKGSALNWNVLYPGFSSHKCAYSTYD
ncbi:hypothetical protein ACP70R_017914 [Stipagrostis hirtigluma subsp. patula]